MRVIRPYTTVPVLALDGRVRHSVVTAVTDQDTITVRVGLVGNGTTLQATRVVSTKTRSTIFAVGSQSLLKVPRECGPLGFAEANMLLDRLRPAFRELTGRN